MPAITYVLPDGTEKVVNVPVGLSIMDGSVRNNLPGIVAECGGGCSCATCHVHLDAATRALFDDPVSEETELLEFLDGADEDSRLSCQLIITEACDGIRANVVDSSA
ncbi:2Fe-2S iron-sulfur cluster-binding protein [Candidatus Frankia alpina]|uniref:2Fe-2S iron-sulfur cluster binding domain-containing protein n=1 Tax=Candidatus Frankia alpina TaxID=2699483 RepID=A0A4S5BLA6_9ACTN|nr:2Fe-2S iron-sulfur cluster-binding protein [Candidatus Frankia alpina]THJ30468.1 2Fe-2S iron-sulfur cluster binding domain-containing protein [Candidatus Frankia alpina]